MTSTVLHVIECYGGGVANAVDQYVRSTPELSHHLMRRFRDDFSEDGQSELFDSVTELPVGAAAARRAVVARVRELDPDVVHAHSSFAGFFVRTALLRGGDSPGRRPRITYTAHGFAFERRDVSALVRFGYLAIERLLAINTDAFAPCSERELALARQVAPRRPLALLPNAVDLEGLQPRAPRTNSVVGVGRLGASKGPAFFADVVEELRRTHGPVEATWVGGGPEHYERMLRRAGVEVTGWLPRRRACARLGEATVYVNTSAWESGPLALLEAAALGVPIAARALPTFAHCPSEYVGDTAVELAAAVSGLLSSAVRREANVMAWRDCFAANSVESQREALLRVYGVPAAVC